MKIPYNYMYRGTDISIYCSSFKVGLIKINRNQKRREFNFFFQSELWSLIFEWFLFQPANTTLKDYGRLQKDGELKVKNHTDNKIRIRWVSLCNLYLTSLLNQVLLSVIGCKILRSLVAFVREAIFKLINLTYLVKYLEELQKIF